MSKYSYSAEDQSLLAPILYKFFVDPLVKILPYRLPANFITLTSFIFIVIAFGIAVHGYYVHRYDFWWLIPLLALLYLVSDCSDGKQARKTGTGSPLGEYFDHFLDSFVTGLLMGILLISFQVTKPIIITIGFFNLYFGQIGTFWERYKRRVMCFGKLSSSEGVLVIGSTSWLMSLPAVHTVADITTVLGITWGEVAIVIIMIGTAISAIHAFLRTRQLSFPIVAHLTLSLSFTYIVASLYADNMVYITIVVTLYNAFFIASLLAATNCGERERLPSIIIPLSCVFFFIRPEYTPLIRHLQIAYLAIRVGIRFAAFVRLHKHYWYWINPPPPSDVSTV